MEEDREILCLPAGTGYYGIEFPYVVELCQEFRISPVPCLQEPYCGVANYKGMIIPVAQLQEGECAGGSEVWKVLAGVTVLQRAFYHQSV